MERRLSNKHFPAWETHSAQELPFPLPALSSQVFSKAVARKVSKGHEGFAGKSDSLKSEAVLIQAWQEEGKRLSGPKGSALCFSPEVLLHPQGRILASLPLQAAQGHACSSLSGQVWVLLLFLEKRVVAMGIPGARKRKVTPVPELLPTERRLSLTQSKHSQAWIFPA